MHSGGNKLTLKLLENEQQVEIIISDNGKGISSSDIPHIFERMYQCDSSRSARGNGLGLSITTELVNAHNGKLKQTAIPEWVQHLRYYFQKLCNSTGLFVYLLEENMKKQGYGKVLARLMLYN